MTWVWTFISKAMDLFYYGLYLFFTKIVKVQKSWDPNISITGTMTITIVFPLLFLESKIIMQPTSLDLILDIIFMASVHFIICTIYPKREAKVLKKYEGYSVFVKVLICIISVLTAFLCWATLFL